jgi:hypothetical protein
MGFLFYIITISHNLASNFNKSVGIALKLEGVRLQLRRHRVIAFGMDSSSDGQYPEILQG